jgi:hypothetical protein
MLSRASTRGAAGEVSSSPRARRDLPRVTSPDLALTSPDLALTSPDLAMRRGAAALITLLPPPSPQDWAQRDLSDDLADALLQTADDAATVLQRAQRRSHPPSARASRLTDETPLDEPPRPAPAPPHLAAHPNRAHTAGWRASAAAAPARPAVAGAPAASSPAGASTTTNGSRGHDEPRGAAAAHSFERLPAVGTASDTPQHGVGVAAPNTPHTEEDVSMRVLQKLTDMVRGHPPPHQLVRGSPRLDLT